MPLSTIDDAIATCRTQIARLDESSDAGTAELKYYLTQAMVMLIVSEYEVHIEKLFASRAKRCGDKQVSNYVQSAIDRQFRSPDINKISETLKRFDGDYHTHFVDANRDRTTAVTAWDKLIKARHFVAHKAGSFNLTFEEVAEAYLETKVVLDLIEDVLHDTAREPSEDKVTAITST